MINIDTQVMPKILLLINRGLWMDQSTLFGLIENYRKKRKRHTDDVWLKKWNIIKRWINSRSGILENHHSADFELASKDINELIDGLKEFQPTIQEVENLQIKLKAHEYIVRDRSYYLGLVPAIFGAIMVVAASDDAIKTGLLIAMGVLSLGFLFERANLNSEKLLSEEVNGALEYYKENIEHLYSNKARKTEA